MDTYEELKQVLPQGRVKSVDGGRLKIKYDIQLSNPLSISQALVDIASLFRRLSPKRMVINRVGPGLRSVNCIGNLPSPKKRRIDVRVAKKRPQSHIPTQSSQSQSQLLSHTPMQMPMQTQTQTQTLSQTQSETQTQMQIPTQNVLHPWPRMGSAENEAGPRTAVSNGHLGLRATTSIPQPSTNS